MTNVNPRTKFGSPILGAGGICLTFTLDHSNFVIPSEFIGIFYAISGVLILFGAYLIFTGGFDWKGFLHIQSSRISLKVAAQKAYDDLYDTVYGRFVRNLNKGNTVNYYANDLTQRTPAYGLDMQGSKKVLIEGIGGGAGAFKDGGDKWGGSGPTHISYTSIEIDRKALDDYIKEKKAVKKIELGT